MKQLTFFSILLLLLCNACKEKLTYIDTIVGKYEGDQYTYDTNGVLLLKTHGYAWIDKIEDYEDRVNFRPGNEVLLRDTAENVFKVSKWGNTPGNYFTLRLIFTNDSLYKRYDGKDEYKLASYKKIE